MLDIFVINIKRIVLFFQAYFYSNCDNIFGVEISKDLCNTQNKIIQSHSLDKRIKVINSDIMEQESILKTSDIVILNNVFEYFISTEKQIEIWKFLKANLKKGCLVVTIPSIEEVLMKLDIYEELTGSAWFTKKTDCQPENNGMFSEDDLASFSDIYFYRIT